MLILHKLPIRIKRATGQSRLSDCVNYKNIIEDFFGILCSRQKCILDYHKVMFHPLQLLHDMWVCIVRTDCADRAGSSIAGWASCGIVCYHSWLGAWRKVQCHSWIPDGCKQCSDSSHCQLCSRYNGHCINLALWSEVAFLCCFPVHLSAGRLLNKLCIKYMYRQALWWVAVDEISWDDWITLWMIESHRCLQYLA